MTHLPPQAGRNPEGKDEEELLSENRGGFCARPEPPAAQPSALTKFPETASFQLLHWAFHLLPSTNTKSSLLAQVALNQCRGTHLNVTASSGCTAPFMKQQASAPAHAAAGVHRASLSHGGDGRLGKSTCGSWERWEREGEAGAQNCIPEELGPPPLKTAEDFGGFKTPGQDAAACLTWS